MKKAPNCTVEDLVIALKELFNSNVKIIGTRHGEKGCETLVG